MSATAIRGTALAAALLLAWTGATSGAVPGEARLSFDILFAEDAGGRLPTQISFSPDGRRLAYLWQEEEEDGLWVHDLAAGHRERVISIRDEPGPRALAEVGEVHWSPSGDALLIVAKGDLFLFDLAASRLERLTETADEESDPKFSPDGSRLAFVRDYDLFLIDLESGAERPLTRDGVENEILNGTTDWVYWEEIWGRDATGFWWSPAGDRIAYYRFDESPVASYPLVDFTTPYPEVTWQKYPTAGERNPAVQVGVLDLASGETAWLATAGTEEAYLGRVDWRRSGDRVAIQQLNRDQDRLDLLLCDPVSGGCRELLSEEADTWINLTLDLHFLEDDRFLWTTEASGWRELLLYSADGDLLRNLTPPGWVVDSVAAVESGGGAVTFSAYRRDELGALHRAVLQRSLTSDESRPLAAGAHWNSVLAASSAGGAVAVARSTANRPAEAFVVDREGTKVLDLPVRAPADFDATELPQWEFLTIPGPSGSRLPAALLKPAGFDPAGRYPAIMYHYGGPASQVVADRWGSRGRGLWHKMMAERGYAVFSVDNQASNFFGKAGADRVHRRFGEVNLAAQRAGVEYLKTLGWIDGERIGIWGWSGGGSNTLYVLLNSPGTWRAGVAGAPVTDWRFYDTIWTERYLDHPVDNPDGYRDSSPITHADKLKDKLLIVHGTADDNVHPNNTLAMMRKLIDAGVAFEDALYPRQKHGFRGTDSRHFYERMTEFFDRHLRK